MSSSRGLGEWDTDGDNLDNSGSIDGRDQGADEDAPLLYYGSVDEFVREMITPVFRRKVGERAALHWSARWWESAEAVIRLEALWRSWEHLRLDPAIGMSVWLRDHADHHLSILMGPEGPSVTCTDSAKAGEPLPYLAPPVELFPDVRFLTATASVDER